MLVTDRNTLDVHLVSFPGLPHRATERMHLPRLTLNGDACQAFEKEMKRCLQRAQPFNLIKDGCSCLRRVQRHTNNRCESFGREPRDQPRTILCNNGQEPARHVPQDFTRKHRILACLRQNGLDIALLSEAKAVTVKIGAARTITDGINLRPAANLKHTAKTEPLVTDAFVYRFTAQRDLRNRLKVSRAKTVPPVGNVETAIRQFAWGEDNCDLTIIAISWVSIMSILD
ncbi:hypothetical protein D3C79_654850 [compost metagenome]